MGLSLDYFKTGDRAKLDEALRIFGTDENTPYYKSVETLDKMVANELLRSQAAVKAANDAERKSLLYAGIAIAAGVALVVGLIFLIYFTVSKPVARVIRGLTAAAEQVSRASGQVASSGQMLAGGASEQAARLEETSASLEEIAGMTRQNAEDRTPRDVKSRVAQPRPTTAP